MSKKIILSLLAAAVLFLPSCKRDTPMPEIPLDITDITGLPVSADGGEVRFKVITNSAWSIIDQPAYAGQYTCVPAQGTSAQEVSVIVEPNESLEERTIVLTVASGHYEKEVVILQSGGTLVAAYRSGYGNIHSLGGETYINVSTVLSWTAELVDPVTDSWLTLEGASGSGSGSFKASVKYTGGEFYNSGFTRLAEVRLTGTGSGSPVVKTFYIGQNGITIPDKAFFNYLTDPARGIFEMDSGNNIVRMTDAGLEFVTMDISGLGIKSLAGIEHFPQLEYLNCNGTSVESLDLSRNKELLYLFCRSTDIRALDIRDNTKLIQLDCQGTYLSSIDLTKNRELNSVDISKTNISSVNIANNPALMRLYCGMTGISSLNLTANTELLTLECNDTSVSSLNLAANTALTNLVCNNTSITSLDLRANTGLISLMCYGCPNLASLNVSNCSKLGYMALFTGPEDDGEHDHDSDGDGDSGNAIDENGILVLTPPAEAVNPYKSITADNIGVDTNGQYVWTGLKCDNNPVIEEVSIRNCQGLESVAVSGNSALRKVYIKGSGSGGNPDTVTLSGTDQGKVDKTN